MREPFETLGLYIHIPFCAQKCHYCDFASYPGMEPLWADYCRAVVQEIEIKSDLFQDKTIDSVFIGGGTPSLLSYPLMGMILARIRRLTLNPQAEITLEANPGTLTGDKVKAYADMGVNRMSLGLQAYQENLLQFLGRIHTGKQFDEAVMLIKSHGIANINADILFGMPHQTLADFRQTLRRVGELELPHVSCYGLKVEENTEFGRLQAKGLLADVDDDLDRQMYDEAIAVLGSKGLLQYELSNFAKPGFECRHNIRYWERGPYIGLGAGAHSFEGSRRYANTADVKAYIQGIGASRPALSEDNRIEVEEAMAESLILGLRMNRGVDFRALSRQYGVDFFQRYARQLENLSAKQLVDCTGTMVRLSKKGMDFANQVFIEFI